MIIKHMPRKGLFRMSVFLLVDLCLTSLIFVIFFIIGTVLTIVIDTYIDIPTPNWGNARILGFGIDNSILAVIILYVTTLFTSVWVWLYGIGWIIVYNGSRIQRILEILQFLLPIKIRPMRAIGEAAAIVTALFFVILGGLGVDFGGDRHIEVSLAVLLQE